MLLSATPAGWMALARIPCPTLVVRGAASDILAPETADKMVEGIVHAEPFGKASVQDVEIWKNNPEAWDEVRIQAGRMLHKMAKE